MAANEQTKNFASMSADELNALLGSLKAGQAELKAGQAKLEAELTAANKGKIEAEAKLKEATEKLETQLKADADKTLWQKAKENWMSLTGAVVVGAAAGAGAMYYMGSDDAPSNTGDM